MPNENMHYHLFYDMFYKLWIINFFVFRVVLKGCFIIVIYTVYLRTPTAVFFFVSHLSPFCLLKILMLHYFRWSLDFRDFFLRNRRLCYSCCWEPRIPYHGHNIFKRKRQKNTTTVSWCILDHRIKRWDYFVFLYMIKI